MLSELDRALLLKLIAFRGTGRSIKEFFSYVLETDPDLKIVGKLVHEIKVQDAATLKWIKQSCLVKRVNHVEFVEKINQLLTNYTTIPAQIRKQYQVLQLTPWANKDEIKRQYRKLAHQYHPDTSGGEGDGKRELFVELAQAYHSILEEEGYKFVSTPQIYPSCTAVEQDKPVKNPVVQRARRKNMIWYITTCSILLVLAVVSERIYQDTVMIRQLATAHSVDQQKDGDKSPKVPSDSPSSKNTITNEKPNAEENALLKSNVSHRTEIISDSNQDLSKEIKGDATKNIQQVTDPIDLFDREEVQLIAETVKISGHDRIFTVSSQDEADCRHKESNHPVQHNSIDRKAHKSMPDYAKRTQYQRDESRKNVTQTTRIKPPNYFAVKEAKLAVGMSQHSDTKDNIDFPAPKKNPEVKTEKTVEKSHAVQPISDSSRELPVKNQAIDEQMVRSFVNKYISVYNRRSLSSFKLFFTPDARENGKLVTERWSSYIQLFSQTEILALDFTVSRIKMQSAGAHVNGTITLHRSYPDGRKQTDNGLMSLYIVSIDRSLLVKNLEYSFFTNDRSL